MKEFSWITLILALIFLFFFYLTFMKNKKTPSINFNMGPVLYAGGLIATFWFLTPLFFPNFWAKYYGSDLFWPTVLIAIFCLYMWSQKYFLFMFIFFFIIFYILYRFGDFNTGKGKKTVEAKITVIDTNTGKVIYEGLTPKTITTSNPFDVIPQTCGATVHIWSKGWRHGVDAQRDCNKVWVPLSAPARKSNDVYITTVQN